MKESEGEWSAPEADDLNTEVDELYERVCQAIGRRLKSSPRAPRLYPLGFVHEGHTIQTTHHLQRDLALTIHRLRTGGPLDPHAPLTGYLRGTALETGWAPLVGQFFPEPLTQDQRDVAEQFLGSRLTGAQGPPGTGKTRLIIDLIAATLVERIRTLASDGVMGDQVLVMASTNNRAVDNVFDPLLASPVPLGLRAGSQRVTHSRTTAYFDQAFAG